MHGGDDKSSANKNQLLEKPAFSISDLAKSSPSTGFAFGVSNSNNKPQGTDLFGAASTASPFGGATPLFGSKTPLLGGGGQATPLVAVKHLK